ncbi:hypothetical protein JYK22_22710, partial [Nonomuraea sp. RK-328]|nr:hypothetical protein [Nonomuraea sp. RK-328]
MTREPGYLLSVPPGQVDLIRFSTWAEDGGRALGLGEHAMALRHLDRALATWRGEPLAEFAGWSCWTTCTGPTPPRCGCSPSWPLTCTVPPVLILATLRPEPGGDPEQLRDTLGRLVREPGTERLAPAPFTREEVSAYLSRLSRRDLTDPALAAVLHDRTGGNPFFLNELLRQLDSEHRLDAASLGVPAGVREVIGHRVARLPEPTQKLLRCAAVLGREVSFDALAAVGALPPEEVMSLLEPAVASGLLIELPDGFDYRFSHALVRDALYAELSRLGRTRLHLRAGEALESFPGVAASVLAHHFGAASRVGGAAKAVGHAVRAARLRRGGRLLAPGARRTGRGRPSSASTGPRSS